MRQIELEISNVCNHSRVVIEYRSDDDIASMSRGLRRACERVRPSKVQEVANKIANVYAAKVISVFHS